MKTHNNDPNFSIVMPGGCNAKCSFCFNKEQPSFKTIPISEWIDNLISYIVPLDNRFYQISITGGEPLTSPHLPYLMSVLRPYKAKYSNILITTNGTDLIKNVDTVAIATDHINLSRHHWDEVTNNEIFGGGYHMEDDDVEQAIDLYGARGIDISANCVINDTTKPDFIESYIKWAKAIGFYAVRFRKENGTQDPTPAEQYYKSYKVLWSGSCGVCRTVLQRIMGMSVYWKTSVLEPSDHMDEVFELVYQPNGVAYRDWMGKKELPLIEALIADKYEPVIINKRRGMFRGSTSSCGGSSSSCGRGGGC